MRRLGLATFLAASALGPGAFADVVLKAADGPTFVVFAKHGPFWRPRERGVVGIRACDADTATKLPRPAKVPVGADLGSKPANDVFWDKYDRWMEKVEPGCAAKPPQYYDAASFRGLLDEAMGADKDQALAEVRAFNDVAPDFKGKDDPMLVLFGIIADRYQLMDADAKGLSRLRAVFEKVAEGKLPSLAAPTDGTDPQDLPLPPELAKEPMPRPTAVHAGTNKRATLKLAWGGPAVDVVVEDGRMKVLELKDGLALAPAEGGLIPLTGNGAATLKQAKDAGLGVETFDLTTSEWAGRNRDSWTLQEFRKVYAALGEKSSVFIFTRGEKSELFVRSQGKELSQVVTSEPYPLEEALVKRVGTKNVFRGARAAAELIRLQSLATSN